MSTKSSKPSISPPFSLTRRKFIYYSALAAGATVVKGVAATGPRPVSPNEKLNLAAVGINGKGSSDIDLCASENIVALCDVDEKMSAGRREKYPKANFYRDFRKMLETEKAIDGVIIATPDHLHATIAAAAMKLGKHVYCQKPLVQTVYEARLLSKLAKDHNVATQMGNQGSAEDGLRRAVEVVQAGLIGSVAEVHVWSNRPIWPQGMDRPAGEDPVPATMDWDLWLGPAKLRPYKEHYPDDVAQAGGGGGRRQRNNVYHPFVWRGWQDFGTGALGDMACHTANMPFRALKLGYPTEVEASSSGINAESYPKNSKIRFEFPAREGLAPVRFMWYDGGNKPEQDVTTDVRQLQDTVPGSGCLLVGDKGTIFSPDDYGAKFFLRMKGDKEMVDGRNHDAVKAIPQAIPRNEFTGDTDARHHLEWIAACKGGKQGYSDFSIAAYLTEIILLGCVALRVGKKLEWDGPAMKAKNAPEAAHFVKRDNRKGWEL